MKEKTNATINTEVKSYNFLLLLTIMAFIIFSISDFLQVYSQEDDNKEDNSQNEDINIIQEQRDNSTFYFPEVSE